MPTTTRAITGFEDLIWAAQIADMSSAECLESRSIKKHYQALKLFGRLHDTIPAAIVKAKRRARRRSRRWPPPLQERLRCRRHLIPLGPMQARWALERGREACPRYKNWIAACAGLAGINGSPLIVLTHNEGRYSSRCTYTKYIYQPCVESWGFISHRGLRYHFYGETYFFPHPHGYRWISSNKEIYLRRKADRKLLAVNGDNLVNAEGKRRPLRYLTALVRVNGVKP